MSEQDGDIAPVGCPLPPVADHAQVGITEDAQHVERDSQFRYLNDIAESFIDGEQPTISVDTKKEELIGDDASRGNKWSSEGEPERVQAHDR